MTMNEATEVLNCSSSNIYRLIGMRKLEPLLDRPGVTRQSIKRYLHLRYPRLDITF